jgi:hypothetical protein
MSKNKIVNISALPYSTNIQQSTVEIPRAKPLLQPNRDIKLITMERFCRHDV